MSNQGFTPGPLRMDHDGSNWMVVTDDYPEMVDVWGFNGMPAVEVVANARLIAAAPDLFAVAECEEALDMPHNQAVAILERYGWSYADRFEFPATEFVKRLRGAAIAKARGTPC